MTLAMNVCLFASDRFQVCGCEEEENTGNVHTLEHAQTHTPKPAKREKKTKKMATWASPSEPVTSPTTSIPAAERAAEALTLVVVLQMTLLVVISVTGTFANALVFAVFYRRPSLRTISNR
jgi:hypothetical protein